MNIGIKIVERKPIVEGSPRLVCGNSGDTITFTFDSEWSNYTAKVARFVYVKNGVVEHQEVLFNGNVVEIPVFSNITEVYIGVYAGDLRTTTPVVIPCDFSILCKGGELVDPAPDIYTQILDALNEKLILEGNAPSATMLETPRDIHIDLESNESVSFDGTEDVNPGVTGILSIENGGTGADTPEGVRDNLELDTLYAPVSTRVDLEKSGAVSHDEDKGFTTGVVGTLPISKGGTGATTPEGIRNNLNLDELYANHIVGKATGNAISIDSSKAPLHNLKLFGRTTQDGTPTPDNPIPLVSTGDSGNFKLEIFGKNLLKVTTNGLTNKGVTYVINDDKSISVSGTPTDTTSWKNLTVNGGFYLPNGRYKLTCSGYKDLSKCYPVMYYKDANGDSQGLAGLTANKDTVTFDVTTGKNNVHLVVGCYPDYTPQGERLYISIIPENITDLSYEPCNKEVTSPFNYTLRGIDDVKDEINFNGEIYDYIYKGTYTQRILKITADDITDVSMQMYNGAFRYAIGCGTFKVKTNLVKCNMFTYRAEVLGNNGADKAISAYTGSTGVLYVRYDDGGSAEEFKAFLKANNFECLVILEEPIETPIDILDFEIFRAIRTNKGATTILSEADMELSYYLNNDDAQAIGNVHELLDYNYWTLKRAIISLGGDI